MSRVSDDFEKIEPALRAQLTTRVGQEVRARRRTRQLQAVVDMLERHGFDPQLAETQQLARVVAILASSPVYLDQVGAPRERVLDDIAWAVRALTASVRSQADEPRR